MPRGKQKTATKSDGFDRKSFFNGLSEFNEAYQTATVDFEPPDGEYVCKLTGINMGEFKPKKGKLQGTKQLYASPQFEILDGGDLEGVSFGVFTSTMVPGIFKQVYASINGEVIDDIQACVEEAEDKIGETYTVTVSTGKKGYKNYRIAPTDLEEDSAEDED